MLSSLFYHGLQVVYTRKRLFYKGFKGKVKTWHVYMKVLYNICVGWQPTGGCFTGCFTERRKKHGRKQNKYPRSRDKGRSAGRGLRRARQRKQEIHLLCLPGSVRLGGRERSRLRLQTLLFTRLIWFVAEKRFCREWTQYHETLLISHLPTKRKEK